MVLRLLNVDNSLIKRHNLGIAKCFRSSNCIAIYDFDILQQSFLLKHQKHKSEQSWAVT